MMIPQKPFALGRAGKGCSSPLHIKHRHMLNITRELLSMLRMVLLKIPPSTLHNLSERTYTDCVLGTASFATSLIYGSRRTDLGWSHFNLTMSTLVVHLYTSHTLFISNLELFQPHISLVESTINSCSNSQRTPNDCANACQKAGKRLRSCLSVDDLHRTNIVGKEIPRYTTIRVQSLLVTLCSVGPSTQGSLV